MALPKYLSQLTLLFLTAPVILPSFGTAQRYDLPECTPAYERLGLPCMIHHEPDEPQWSFFEDAQPPIAANASGTTVTVIPQHVGWYIS